MSCFFDSITASLNIDELRFLNCKRYSLDVIIKLKSLNRLTPNVTWQNTMLTNQLQKENYEHIKNYKEDTYRNGYYTSSCDPFLLLLSELFRWNIIFYYCNNIINIKHHNPLRTVKFRASSSHFSICS